MNAKENYLAYLNHENVEWIPNPFAEVTFAGGGLETFENGPAGGGEDGFGCRWHSTNSANGQPVPEPNFYVLDDVENWKDVVKFPNLDEFDWEEAAKTQLAGINRDERAVEYHSWNSQFLRLTHLMGFENGLCALVESPEACYDLMDAVTNYKIQIIERAAKYFKPESFVNYDDVATERGLFMSPDAYRKLIKPHHKRMNEAAKAYGMLPQQHCCGFCEEIIPDFIDEGAVAWQAAQPSNDIVNIIKTYKDKFSVTGGYDTLGRPGTPDVTQDEIKAEVARCMNTYGIYKKGYAFMGFLVTNADDPNLGPNMGAMFGEAAILGRSIMEK